MEEVCVFENLDQVGGIETLNGTSTRCPTVHKQGQCKAHTPIYFKKKIKIVTLLVKMTFYSFCPTFLSPYLFECFFSIIAPLCIFFKCWCFMVPFHFSSLFILHNLGG